MIDAIEEYEAARKRGEREVRLARAQGRYPYLTVLDDMIGKEDSAGEETVGYREIPLSMVVGTKTEGRQKAFSAGFMPLLALSSEFSRKWQSLIRIQVDEGFRDPIRVYEYMNRFYVQEGNKRVSVMKYLGSQKIAAEITRILPKKSDDPEIRRYYAFLEFYRVAPLYEIVFSKEESYEKLAEIMGQDLDNVWPQKIVDTLKSMYLFFSFVFRSKFRDRGDATIADALLVYLSVYESDWLLDTPASLVEKRIEKLWNEIQTSANDDNIALVHEPSDDENAPGLLSLLRKRMPYSDKRPLRVAFLYEKDTDVSRWAYGHELGRLSLSERFGSMIETQKFENCEEDGAIRDAIDKAAAGGADVIFTTSPEQMDETSRAAFHYPKIHFLNCSVNLPHQAVRTYYGRMYEAKFLMGALAASVSADHRIGYRADRPIFGAVSEINAFAIGAALVDPNAKIELVWASKRGTDWRREMKERGLTVISGPDLIRPVAESSREFGIYTREADGQIRNLAVPLWDWGKYYEIILRSILHGGWDAAPTAGNEQAINYWYGMSAGVIDVLLSDHISYYSKKLVEMLRAGIVSDSLHPFAGELHSQTGVIQTGAERRITSADIISMNWLNDNIIGEIPTEEELNEDARALVRVSGLE